MRSYPGHSVGDILKIPAITILALLNEAEKINTYDRRWQLMLNNYDHFDDSTRQQIDENLRLPDDLLKDIIEDEKADNIKIIKEAFE